MERGIIDRFEGDDIVVIEISQSTRDYPRAALPQGAKPGDSVIIEDGVIRLDESDTKKRKKEIDALMDELFE